MNETDLLKVLKNKSNTDKKYLIIFNDLEHLSDKLKKK
jgi:hypothetical protein